MKTDALIAALAADRPQAGPPVSRIVLAAWAGGIALAALVFFAAIGLRADIATALGTPRFVFKIVFVVVLAVVGAGVVARLGRPGARLGYWGWALGLLALIAVAAVVAELFLTPRAEWSARLVGSNVASCLTLIPLLSIAPAVLMLAALRRAAPTRPRLAGAAAGLLAAATAASLYALNCTDDSPLFVATWYPLAGATVIALTTIAGGKILRW